MEKRVVQLSTMTKISSEIGFMSVNWAIPEKRWGLKTQLFEKDHWNFQVCCFTLGNSGQYKATSLEILQNYMTPLGQNETKFFVIFSLLPLKILVVSCVTPRNSTFYFFKIFLENPSPGIGNFMTSPKQTNYIGHGILGRITLSTSFLE